MSTINFRMVVFGILCMAAISLSSCAATKISDTMIKTTVINATPEKIGAYTLDGSFVLDSTGSGGFHEWMPGWNYSDIQGEGVGQTDSYVIEIAGEKYFGQVAMVEGVKNQKGVYKFSGDIDATWSFISVPVEKGTKMIVIWEYSVVPKGDKEAFAKDLDSRLDQMLKMIREKVEK